MRLLNSIGTSRKLRSLPPPSPSPSAATTALSTPLPSPSFDSLSTRYHNRMRLEPRRIQSVQGEYQFFTCSCRPSFALSASLPFLLLPFPFLPIPFLFRELSTSPCLSFHSVFSFLFFVPVALVLMTPLLSRESLPGERFATEGCSYRFPGAFRPFAFPLSSVPLAASAPSFASHSQQARNRHVTLESVIGKLTRCVWEDMSSSFVKTSRIVGYFF